MKNILMFLLLVFLTCQPCYAQNFWSNPRPLPHIVVHQQIVPHYIVYQPIYTNFIYYPVVIVQPRIVSQTAVIVHKQIITNPVIILR